MATQVEVPPLGESVTQAILVKWHKSDGDAVKTDEAIAELETDKANVDIPAKTAGVLRRLKEVGETVNVGEAIARIDDSPSAQTMEPATAGAKKSEGAAAKPARTSAPPPKTGGAAVALEDYSPAVRRLIEENHLNPGDISPTGPNGRLTKEDVENHLKQRDSGNGQQAAATAPSPAPTAASTPPPSAYAPGTRAASQTPPRDVPAKASVGGAVKGEAAMMFDANGIHRAPMSKIRKRIAETLVRAQQTAAILTTFNEVDLTEIIALRAKFKEQFEKVHGVGLGFMSFFARAVVLALNEVPRVNAFIEGDDVVYHNYVNLGIAVSTDRGLAVPVLRNVQDMSFARIEAEIKRLATAVRDGKLGLEELSGGTFSITNGGVFGSMLSTPILNPPQSGILGMHNIQKRAVVINDKIEVRSMMYLALSYDHRLVDGREAITFLVRLKQLLEDPARLMLAI